MWFHDWLSMVRVALFMILGYVALVVLLRLAGKRTLSQMDEFDLAVTVAVGSTLAMMALARDVAWVEGVLALAILMVLQVVVTWMTSRSKRLYRLIESEPTLLFFGGRMLREAMKQMRVSEGEILHAIRGAGVGATEDVDAVVLETNGAFSVIRKGSRSLSALGTLGQDPEIRRSDVGS